MVLLLYFDEMQTVNVNLLIGVRRLTHTPQNEVSPGFTLHFAFRQSKATLPTAKKLQK